MRISDWSSDVCSSDLLALRVAIDELVGMAARQHGEPHQFLGDIDDAVIIARGQHASCVVELGIGLGDARLVGDGDHPHPAAEDAQCVDARSEEHTSELQSLMRISYAVFCLKKKNIMTISRNEYKIKYIYIKN